MTILVSLFFLCLLQGFSAGSVLCGRLVVSGNVPISVSCFHSLGR